MVATFKIKDANTILGTISSNTVLRNSEGKIGGIVAILDDKYILDDDYGTLDITCEIVCGDEIVNEFELVARRHFRADAVKLIKKANGLSVANKTMQIAQNETKVISASILGDGGSENNDIRWESSDNSVAMVGYDGTVYGVNDGTATITATIVPRIREIVFAFDGTSEDADIMQYVPRNLHKTQAIVITVGKKSSGGDEATTPKPDITIEVAPEVKPNITFRPDKDVTRAEFLTLLHKTGLIKGDSASDLSTFTDVANDSWYAKYVIWAFENGIVRGNGDGTFTPDGVITREQMAVMLCNFIEKAGIKLSGDVKIAFVDSDSMSDWAIKAIEKLTRAGILNGKGNGIFDPVNSLTKGESAKVLCGILYQ